MCPCPFTTRVSGRLHRELSFDIVLYLLLVNRCPKIALGRRFHTFVTRVPARKNTISKAKGKLQGCTACATAVNVAATIPAGVKD
jgi:hypothetical protein